MRRLLFVFLLWNGSAGAHEQLADFETQRLSDAVYVLVGGGGGNIGVSAGPDGIFIIDDSFAPLAPRVIEGIAKIKQGPVRFVINTHWHSDHTGGNELLAESGALIVAHENVRERMSVRQLFRIPTETLEVPPAPDAALPVVTFTRDLTLHLNGDEVAVLHFAHAHTDGDVVIHFRKDNIVHTGDFYVNGLFPFIDASSGGSLTGIVAAVERLLSEVNDETKIIPGHGPMSNKEELRAFHTMLITAKDRIGKLVAEGKTIDEVLDAQPLADHESWGEGFIRTNDFVRMIYRELKIAS